MGEALRAALRTVGRATRYDSGIRRLAQRHGRETGRRVYLPADEIIAAGFSPSEPIYYRTTGYQRSANAGSVIVSLYREP